MPLKLVLDIAKGQRPISIGGDPRAVDDMLVINGRNVAREILGPTAAKAKADH